MCLFLCRVNMSIAIVELVATPGGEEDNLCQNNQDFKVYYSNLLLLNGLVLTIDIKKDRSEYIPSRLL